MNLNHCDVIEDLGSYFSELIVSDLSDFECLNELSVGIWQQLLTNGHCKWLCQFNRVGVSSHSERYSHRHQSLTFIHLKKKNYFNLISVFIIIIHKIRELIHFFHFNWSLFIIYLLLKFNSICIIIFFYYYRVLSLCPWRHLVGIMGTFYFIF